MLGKKKIEGKQIGKLSNKNIVELNLAITKVLLYINMLNTPVKNQIITLHKINIQLYAIYKQRVLNIEKKIG